MRIGCPREIKNHEYRVGLTPGSVREYIAHGHEVIVETGAGAGIGADDNAYRAAGAAIALTGFSGDIGRRPLDATPTEEPPEYEDLVPAPLSECYDHHWVAMYQDYENALCKSFHHRGHDPTFTFGIGAETSIFRPLH